MAIPLQNTHAQYMVQLRPHNLILRYKLDTLMTCLVPFSLLLLFLILSSGFIPFPFPDCTLIPFYLFRLCHSYSSTRGHGHGHGHGHHSK